MKIINECQNEGLREPDYELNSDHFAIIFYRKGDERENIRVLQKGNVTKDVTKERLKEIINRIKGDPKITTQQLANELKITKRTILRDIEKLDKRGVLSILDLQMVVMGKP